jgi:hypothetical protein
MQPVQLSLIPGPIGGSSIDAISMFPPPPQIDALPAQAVQRAITLLAGVIAKAATANPIEAAGDE